jgi:hypothetical protein
MRYISLPVVVAVYFIAENKNPPSTGGFFNIYIFLLDR